jgi:hypothetical protein
MMGNYAIVDSATGIVEGVAVWDGITEWSPGEGYIAVESDVASHGWKYSDGIFTCPLETPPTEEEILTVNTATQTSLLAYASQVMTPLLLFLQLGNATNDETTLAELWQDYYRAVQAVDLTVNNQTWPAQPS